MTKKRRALDHKPRPDRDLPLGWKRVSNGAVSVDGWVVLQMAHGIEVRSPHGRALMTEELAPNGMTVDVVHRFATIEGAIDHVERRYRRQKP